MNYFREFKCKYFYVWLKEAIPPNSPKERGKEVDLSGYVNSDHADEKKARISRSEFFILLNTVLIQWFSNK